ncbi:hypothetical protein GGF46_002303 [Coemansia sp. RSA 552]|nr:hypothetical protein GGF46_002303 [Coemansia sp. RSA 552]
MEYFVQSVESQTYPLNSWDMAAAFTNIPYIYYFKNSGGTSDAFMASGTMRVSFYRTLLDFPILAGSVRIDAQGHGFVDVDRGKLNMPEYLETQSQVHYSEVEAAGFRWGAIPEQVATVGTFPTCGDSIHIKLANVNIIRLRDNSGLVLFVSIPHYVMDGVGYCAFVNHWAETCKLIGAGTTETQLPRSSWRFNRSAIPNSLPESRTPLGRTMRDIYDSPSWAGSLLGLMLPETRGRLLTFINGIIGGEAHVFHISRASLDGLKAAVQQYVPCGQRVSDNDVLTSLINSVVAAAIHDLRVGSNTESGILETMFRQAMSMLMGKHDEFLTMLVLDARPRLKGLAQAKYSGNCVTCIPFKSPLAQIAQSELAPETFATMCGNVRAAVSSTDAPLLGELYDIQQRDSASYAHAMAGGLFYSEKLVLSNQSRFSLFQNDFGSGIPSWVSPIPFFYANFASVLPVHPAANGYNVYISTETGTMRQILKNQLWTTYTEFVY